ncbi:MAG: thioredoxin family protein [Oceanococcus sp.]
MALTPSRMMPLATPAPDFSLPDTVSGQILSRDQLRGVHATVVMFICNHCPYVIHVEAELARLGRDYADRGVGFVAISANDADNYPADAPDKMKATALANGYTFAYLHDQSQEVARAYGAECTPDFFIFDRDLKCAYRGQLDAARPGNDEPNDGRDIRAALDALIAGQAVSTEQNPSVGCNIKWKY